MPKISLKLSRLSISEKLDLAKRIASSLAGNASFPTPNPTAASPTRRRASLPSNSCIINTTTKKLPRFRL